MQIHQQRFPNRHTSDEGPQHHLIQSRYYVQKKPKMKTKTLIVPSKQKISNLQYNILMNTPELENQTLTSKLFHSGPNDQQCLFKLNTAVTRSSKININALCPNIYIQKLRIVYFLLLTQSYQPLYSQGSTNSPNNTEITTQHLKSVQVNKNKGQMGKQPQNPFRNALNILKLMFYHEESINCVKRKYFAQFFQFLQYDSQNYKTKMASKSQTQNSEPKENIVVNIMNKYPILDEIFIDTLILMIEKKANEEGGVNIDDNYNIKLFLNQSLGLQSKFTSNWEFQLEHINIIIGIDTFSLDYNMHSYMNEIIETLDQKGLLHGLDVSKVGGFDDQVFNRLDMSYIYDLRDVLSNCSDSRHEQYLFGAENVKSQIAEQLNSSRNMHSRFNQPHWISNLPINNKTQQSKQLYRAQSGPFYNLPKQINSKNLEEYIYGVNLIQDNNKANRINLGMKKFQNNRSLNQNRATFFSNQNESNSQKQQIKNDIKKTNNLCTNSYQNPKFSQDNISNQFCQINPNLPIKHTPNQNLNFYQSPDLNRVQGQLKNERKTQNPQSLKSSPLVNYTVKQNIFFPTNNQRANYHQTNLNSFNTLHSHGNPKQFNQMHHYQINGQTTNQTNGQPYSQPIREMQGKANYQAEQQSQPRNTYVPSLLPITLTNNPVYQNSQSNQSVEANQYSQKPYESNQSHQGVVSGTNGLNNVSSQSKMPSIGNPNLQINHHNPISLKAAVNIRTRQQFRNTHEPTHSIQANSQQEKNKQRQIQLDRQKQMEVQLQRQKQIQLERQRQIERENQKQIQKQRIMLERRKQQQRGKQQQKQKQRQRLIEIEKQLQRQRQRQRDRQKQLEKRNQLEKQKWLHRKRQQQAQKQRQFQRQKQIQLKRQQQRQKQLQLVIKQRQKQKQKQKSLQPTRYNPKMQVQQRQVLKPFFSSIRNSRAQRNQNDNITDLKNEQALKLIRGTFLSGQQLKKQQNGKQISKNQVNIPNSSSTAGSEDAQKLIRQLYDQPNKMKVDISNEKTLSQADKGFGNLLRNKLSDISKKSTFQKESNLTYENNVVAEKVPTKNTFQPKKNAYINMEPINKTKINGVVGNSQQKSSFNSNQNQFDRVTSVPALIKPISNLSSNGTGSINNINNNVNNNYAMNGNRIVISGNNGNPRISFSNNNEKAFIGNINHNLVKKQTCTTNNTSVSNPSTISPPYLLHTQTLNSPGMNRNGLGHPENPQNINKQLVQKSFTDVQKDINVILQNINSTIKDNPAHTNTPNISINPINLNNIKNKVHLNNMTNINGSNNNSVNNSMNMSNDEGAKKQTKRIVSQSKQNSDKTQGQKMWERYKMKHSYDEEYLKKQTEAKNIQRKVEQKGYVFKTNLPSYRPQNLGINYNYLNSKNNPSYLSSNSILQNNGQNRHSVPGSNMDYHGKTNNFSITPSAVSLNITPIAAVNSNPTGSYFTDRYILQDKNLVETGSNGNSGNTNGTNAANLKFNNSNNMNVMGEYIKINQQNNKINVSSSSSLNSEKLIRTNSQRVRQLMKNPSRIQSVPQNFNLKNKEKSFALPDKSKHLQLYNNTNNNNNVIGNNNMRNDNMAINMTNADVSSNNLNYYSFMNTNNTKNSINLNINVQKDQFQQKKFRNAGSYKAPPYVSLPSNHHHSASANILKL